jgi:hypothetical protein
MTTAPQDNRGGNRPLAPQNNVGVNGLGGNGSADGVPNIDYTGFAYSQNKEINNQMKHAASNNSTVDRVHLIIDIMPDDMLHYNKTGA